MPNTFLYRFISDLKNILAIYIDEQIIYLGSGEMYVLEC